MKFIDFKDVTKTYSNGITACADISVQIEKGEFVFVIGLTASGKSTLIKMLYREEKPTKGTVMVGGVNVGKLRNRKVYKYRRKVGIVFQDFKLLPSLTVYENVAFALECVGDKSSDIRPKVLKALDRVGLKDKVRSFPNELSGGEMQRVSIARALAKDPKIILCDEPTGALDYNTGKNILKLLQDTCKNSKKTVIIITHNSAITKIADRVINVKNGTATSITTSDHPLSATELEW